jgi:hypothetical protein
MVLPIFRLARQFNFRVVIKDGAYLLGGAGFAFIPIEGAFKTARKILRIPSEDGRLRFESGVVIVERDDGLSPAEETLATEPYKHKLPRRNRDRILRGFTIPNNMLPEWIGGLSLPAAISEHLNCLPARRVSFSDGYATVLTPDCHISTPIKPEIDIGKAFDMGLLLTARALAFYSCAVVESGLRYSDNTRGVYIFAQALKPLKPCKFEGGDVIPAQTLNYRVSGNDVVVDLGCIDHEPIRVARSPFVALMQAAKTIRIKVVRNFAMIETESGIGSLRLRS